MSIGMMSTDVLDMVADIYVQGLVETRVTKRPMSAVQAALRMGGVCREWRRCLHRSIACMNADIRTGIPRAMPRLTLPDDILRVFLDAMRPLRGLAEAKRFVATLSNGVVDYGTWRGRQHRVFNPVALFDQVVANGRDPRVFNRHCEGEAEREREAWDELSMECTAAFGFGVGTNPGSRGDFDISGVNRASVPVEGSDELQAIAEFAHAGVSALTKYTMVRLWSALDPGAAHLACPRQYYPVTAVLVARRIAEMLYLFGYLCLQIEGAHRGLPAAVRAAERGVPYPMQLPVGGTDVCSEYWKLGVQTLHSFGGMVSTPLYLADLRALGDLATPQRVRRVVRLQSVRGTEVLSYMA